MNFDDHYSNGECGTRFKLFPQPPFLEEYGEPEVVEVSSPAGSIGPGPSDHRMFVVDPLDKTLSYGLHEDSWGESYIYLPPWDGDRYAPVVPDALGHFDYLEPGTREFECAHLFGTVRWVLDIWEGYFGREIEWHFSNAFPRLELILLDNWDNAQSGFGFIEVGYFDSDAGTHLPYALNFDILAHEVGHSIIYAEVGVPVPETEAAEYFGFHESAADLVALISVMHFDSVVDNLLHNTRGNLYTLNKLSRIAELSEYQQVRLAANTRRLSEFVNGWVDEHQLAQPLTGAVFDVFIDVFHSLLHDRGLIHTDLAVMADTLPAGGADEREIQRLFDAQYENRHEGFKLCLLEARDIIGYWLAFACGHLSPHYFDYGEVMQAMLHADEAITGGRYRFSIEQNFSWRYIGSVAAGPRLPSALADGHVNSTRTVIPD
jgi:hypothetical protein